MWVGMGKSFLSFNKITISVSGSIAKQELNLSCSCSVSLPLNLISKYKIC